VDAQDLDLGDTMPDTGLLAALEQLGRSGSGSVPAAPGGVRS
jgi:hypothetical protein